MLSESGLGHGPVFAAQPGNAGQKDELEVGEANRLQRGALTTLPEIRHLPE